MPVDHGLAGRDNAKSKERRDKKAKRVKNIAKSLRSEDIANNHREVKFDDAARVAWLTGFSKRKQERRQYGLAMQVCACPCACCVRAWSLWSRCPCVPVWCFGGVCAPYAVFHCGIWCGNAETVLHCVSHSSCFVHIPMPAVCMSVHGTIVRTAHITQIQDLLMLC